jgi:hypothetical protein
MSLLAFVLCIINAVLWSAYAGIPSGAYVWGGMAALCIVLRKWGGV